MNQFFKNRFLGDTIYVYIHCTAGFSNAQKTNDYFLRPKNQGGAGYKTGGYNQIIEVDGKRVELYPWGVMTNGVLGLNRDSVHISYVGGIEILGTKERPIYKAKNTLNDAQEAGILEAIYDFYRWKNSYPELAHKKVMILGHRDASLDKNSNGVIDPNERIKECPCFDAIPKYQWITVTANNNNQKLPRG